MSSMMPSFLMSALLLAFAGCSSPPPIRTATAVDLERFMGDWYVIANIPTFIETNAYNAMESYRLAEDGTVATTFIFRKGGFEGERKTYHPTGYIIDTQSNAVWGMQFIWPIKADYRIVFVDESYSQTVIGRTARDYVWLMARTPEIPDPDYQRFLRLIAEEGYDVSKVKKVPQRWN
ncbi:MAG: lipocalin family protein [Nitrospira sp.]|nr:lipocalin family protein [Nitrospira sp.]